MPSFMGKNVLMDAALKPVTLNTLRPRIDVGDGPLKLDPFKPVVIKPPVSVDIGNIVTSPIILKSDILWTLVDVLLPRPRAQITVPISPNGIVNENTLFEDPADPNKKYALPIFKLAEQTLPGDTRVRVAIERVLPIDPANQQWQLSVHFGSAPRRADAGNLQSNFSFLLQFTPPVSEAARKELPFTIETEDSVTQKASLQRNGTPERDEMVNALKRFEYQTRFIARCSFSAAVPDSIKDGVQLYRQNSYTVDIPLDLNPFVFDPAQHPYIFSEVQDASAKVFGLKLQPVEYKGRIHHYFQDEASPYTFYYMPDSFKVTRSIDPPFIPQIMVRFNSEDGSKEKMKVSLDYVAAPLVDAERLQAARQALKPQLPASMPPGITEAVFRPLVVPDVSQLNLHLALPRRDGPGSERQTRPGVVSSLSDGFRDEINDLTLDDFQDLFDAIFGKSTFVFTGDVQVEKSGDNANDRPTETIPFNVRLDDLYGRLLVETETASTDGRFAVKLKNGIESPLTVRSIPVFISVDGQLFPAHIENLSKAGVTVPFPVDLAPEEELSFDVTPDQALPAGQSAPDALFDLDDVVVKPDRDAVLSAILDASVPAEYTRTIDVETVEELFAPHTNVLKLGIDFQNGDHVVLDRQNLKAQAHVHVPINDLIVRKLQDSQYQYTQIAVSSTGQTRTTKTDNLDLLFPSLATESSPAPSDATGSLAGASPS